MSASIPETLLHHVVLDGASRVMNVQCHSVREKELVYRMKCVFTLDSAGANLDFLGTSAQLRVLLSFGGQIAVSYVLVTLMGCVTQ